MYLYWSGNSDNYIELPEIYSWFMKWKREMAIAKTQYVLVEYFKSILIYIYKNKKMYYFYTLAEGILISVRSLQMIKWFSSFTIDLKKNALTFFSPFEFFFLRT